VDGRDGFEAFAAGAAPHLARTAYLLTGDAGSCEDLVQDALVGLYVAWPRVIDPYSYARRCLVNATRSRWRRRRRGWEVSVADVLDGVGHPIGDHRDVTPRVAVRQVLMEALAVLPERQRAVVVLRHLDDLTEAQTAQVLGVSVGTVKSQNARAMTRLRELLAPDGLGDVELLREGIGS
jgi:RNA polymerase sigma-70 factor (sigma-E family)